MTVANFVAPGERLINRRRGKPADAHLVPADRIVVTKDIILAADADRGPVAVGFLLRFVHLVLGNVGLERLGSSLAQWGCR